MFASRATPARHLAIRTNWISLVSSTSFPPPVLETKRVEGRMNGKKRRRRKEEEKGGEKKCRAAIEKDEIYLPVCTRASVDSISREVLYVSKPCNDSVITVKNTGTYIRTHRGIYRVSCTIFPCKSKSKIWTNRGENFRTCNYSSENLKSYDGIKNRPV